MRKLRSLIGISILTACLIPVGNAAAATLVYPGPCGATLADCVDAADPGDTIRLRTNAVVEIPESFNITKGLSLIAANGFHPTISPTSPATAAYISVQPTESPATVAFRGLNFSQVQVSVEFEVGSGNRGVFESNSLDFNDGSNGGEGVGISYTGTSRGSLSIRNNDVSSVGSGIVARSRGGTALITGNRVTAPAGLGETGIYVLGRGDQAVHATVASNVVHDVGNCNCGGPSGITVGAYESATVNLRMVNNTVDTVGIDASTGAPGIRLIDYSPSTAAMTAALYNNIVSNSYSQGIVLYEDPALTVTGNLNDVFASGPNTFGSYDLGTTLDVDPAYVNPGAANLRLKKSSPLVNAGQTCIASTPLPRGDAAQRFRVRGKAVDLGAYEHGSTVGAGVAGRNVSRDGSANTIRGTNGRDILCGLGGADQIRGRGGADLVFGGGGPDRLNVRDGVSGNDTASGGPGHDTCLADPGDRRVSC